MYLFHQLYYSGLSLLIPLVFLTPILWLYCRKKTKHFFGLLLFALYLCAAYSLTGLPNIRFVKFDCNVNLIPILGIVGDLRNSILNVLLFVPMGVFLPLLWKKYRIRKETLLFSLGATGLIELSQLFNYRATDINDILMNVLGAFLGFLAAKTIWRRTTPEENTKPLRFTICAVLLFMFFAEPLGYDLLWRILP